MDPIVTGSLISAGASLLGGFVSGKDANKNHKKQVERMRNQQVMLQHQLDAGRPSWIRQGAEAGGFNPLLFAGPSGVAGNLSSPAITSNPMGDAIARAGAVVADGFGKAADLDMQRAELDLERQRVEALAENLKLRPKVPGVYGTGGDKPVGEPQPLIDNGRATVTNASHLDAGAYIDPRSPDAEMGETRYGDIAQEITGAVNVYRDFTYDRKLQSVVKQYGRDVADKVHQTYASDPSITLDDAIKRHTDPIKEQRAKNPKTLTPKPVNTVRPWEYFNSN